MRRKLVVGNWKMHASLAMVQGVVSHFKNLSSLPAVDLALCVPFPYLLPLRDACDHMQLPTPIAVGAQNVSEHAGGAFTGEVSAAMLQELGCRYVIVGHSERRSMYGEDDALVGRKALAVLNAQMTPIVCIGETMTEREAGQVEAVLQRQLDAVLQIIGSAGLAQVVVAYEPVWAIGSGVAATPAQISAVLGWVRAWLVSHSSAAQQIRILYGGSVKPDTAAAIFALPDCDGGLIGGASLVAADFAGICTAAQACVE
jgi:triosephosphate isomerase